MGMSACRTGLQSAARPCKALGILLAFPDYIGICGPVMNWKKELVILLAALGVGAFLGPMIVFLVGQAAFGPYDDGAGMATFYARFWLELGQADPIPWLMFLTPYLLLQWLRLLRIPFSHRGAEPDTPLSTDQT